MFSFHRVCPSLIIVLFIILLNCEKIQPYSKKFVTKSPLGVYKKAAVAANGHECAQVGADILKRNGSAIDAAIATLLCDSVACPHSLGLGGGFLMTIYDATTKNVTFLNAKEVAPAAASKDMARGDPKLLRQGGLAVAVPGQVMGFWEAHKKYGKLPWKELFEPAIQLCETGTVVSRDLIRNLYDVKEEVENEPTLSELFINPATKKFWHVGYKLKRPILAKTFRILAEHESPIDLFYRGALRDQLVEEIQQNGGIISHDDFSNYRIQWKKPLESTIGNMTMYTSPPPGSGVLLAFMMNVIQELFPVRSEKQIWQKIVETFKYAYAQRTKLGDPDFVDLDNLMNELISKKFAKQFRKSIRTVRTSNNPKDYDGETWIKDDHGTGNVCVIAPDGSAVAVTSSINDILGAKLRSRSTGIILNNQMDDFSSPNVINEYGLHPSPSNFIQPGKRPLSSMAPTIVLDHNNDVRMIVGAAGGSKITTAVTLVMTLHLLKGYSIKEAIDARRIHHQFLPMEVQHEKGFSPKVLKHLRNVGHTVNLFNNISNSVTAVAHEHDTITAYADYRRQGKNAGF